MTSTSVGCNYVPPKDRPKTHRKRPAFRGALLDSSGACANHSRRVLRLGVAGQVSCLCALRVRSAPSRLIAPKRPQSIAVVSALGCHPVTLPGRAFLGLKQRMLLFQFLPPK